MADIKKIVEKNLMGARIETYGDRVENEIMEYLATRFQAAQNFTKLSELKGKPMSPDEALDQLWRAIKGDWVQHKPKE